MSTPTAPAPLFLKFTREPFDLAYIVTFPDNSTEVVDCEDALEWLRLRHAGRMNLSVVEKALDDCWNFGSAEIVITTPRVIVPAFSRTAPKI